MGTLDDYKAGIAADARWQLAGHAEEMKRIEELMAAPDAASKIATYILSRDQRKKAEWKEVGPCGRHPIVCYVAGVGFDGPNSYKQFPGYGFPMDSQELTDAGLVRVCDMCRDELETQKATKQ